MAIFVTGGSGFIGRNLIRNLLKSKTDVVVNVDKLTYINQVFSDDPFLNSEKYIFAEVDICDSEKIFELLKFHKPHTVFNLAAETHVDNSIRTPQPFLTSNIMGTFSIIETCQQYWENLKRPERENFKFIHISTDEIYGSLAKEARPSNEEAPIKPNNPYSASKAASNHLIRAWHKTYNFPGIVTNCSNNYGPYQHTEKVIPKTIQNALADKQITIYGDGKQIRDWLYVDDHCEALELVSRYGKFGEAYNVGGGLQITNSSLMKVICEKLDKIKPKKNGKSYLEQLTFVADRLGHDQRYEVNWQKLNSLSGWVPTTPFEEGLDKTIRWYLENLKSTTTLQ